MLICFKQQFLGSEFGTESILINFFILVYQKTKMYQQTFHA